MRAKGGAGARMITGSAELAGSVRRRLLSLRQLPRSFSSGDLHGEENDLRFPLSWAARKPESGFREGFTNTASVILQKESGFRLAGLPFSRIQRSALDAFNVFESYSQ
jgi:hypothetical protein